jgi:hypothetical protein
MIERHKRKKKKCLSEAKIKKKIGKGKKDKT